MEEDRRVYFTARDHEGTEVKIVIRLLLESEARETVYNFYKLITSKDDKISYRNTCFTRIISPEFIIQGGNIEGFQENSELHNGHLLVEKEVKSETTLLNKRGQVAVACDLNNVKPESEFFITLTDLSKYENLQGRFVVIGEVESGLDKFVEMTKDVEVDEDFRPYENYIRIIKTGELKKKPKLNTSNQKATTPVLPPDQVPIEQPAEREEAPRRRKMESDSHRDSRSTSDKHSDHHHRRHHHHHHHHSFTNSRSSRGERDDGRGRRRGNHESDRSSHHRHSDRNHYHVSRSDDRNDYMDRDPTRLKSRRIDPSNNEVRKGRGFR